MVVVVHVVVVGGGTHDGGCLHTTRVSSSCRNTADAA